MIDLPNGTLFITARSASEALPIETAVIRITNSLGFLVGEETLTAEDEGLSLEFSLEAPSASESLSPQEEAPYSTYTVEISSPGFQSVRIEDIQMFGGIRSQLPIEMIPLAERAPGETITYTIPPNAIRSDSPRNPEFSDDARILGRVFIPEKIRVHLGTPTQSAQNISVSFPDYIKNVASSEIYPTWPEESLRANILCQISLALNRVFTEWYPSRGYNFDITNSTAYDQFFVPGRNIFEPIEEIVDQIFNQYIAKPGRVEPFFAEYCNGTSVSCAGLSQWGTVSLAGDGLSAREILEFYYGEVEIRETNEIRAIEGSYPGYPLSLGSSGEAVLTLQRQLNRIAINYPKIPTLTPDGVFGASTQRAVEEFQRLFLMTVDGIVGKSTWYRISYIYAAVKKLAELNSEGERPIYNQYIYPGSPIRYGDTGSSVQEVQFFLQRIGTFNSAIPAVTVDGRFGEGTRNAVRAFQRYYGLTADGIVGETTWNQLVAVYKGTQDEPTPSPAPSYPGTPVRRGQSGANVRAVQTALNTVGDVFVTIPEVSVDGVFGAGTERSVIAFQRLFGLVDDGIVGRATWDKLFDLQEVIESDCIFSTLSENTRPFPGTILRQGSRGADVRYVQNLINVIRRALPILPLLSADGIYGDSTREAVTSFQRIFGLSADGLVGSRTWQLLNYVYSAVVSGCLPTANTRSMETALPVSGEILPDFPGTLRVGHFGETVRVAKKQLSQKVLCGEDVGRENNLFGVSTRKAVREFQRESGLEESGIIDEETWRELFR